MICSTGSRLIGSSLLACSLLAAEHALAHSDDVCILHGTVKIGGLGHFPNNASTQVNCGQGGPKAAIVRETGFFWCEVKSGVELKLSLTEESADEQTWTCIGGGEGDGNGSNHFTKAFK